jgi:hypothetical protein
MGPSAVTVQEATAAELESITTNGGAVEIFCVPAPCTTSCANDSFHGKGVYFDAYADGLCLACAIVLIESRLVSGMLISGEVYA